MSNFPVVSCSVSVLSLLPVSCFELPSAQARLYLQNRPEPSVVVCSVMKKSHLLSTSHVLGLDEGVPRSQSVDEIIKELQT